MMIKLRHGVEELTHWFKKNVSSQDAVWTDQRRSPADS